MTVWEQRVAPSGRVKHRPPARTAEGLLHLSGLTFAAWTHVYSLTVTSNGARTVKSLGL